GVWLWFFFSLGVIVAAVCNRRHDAIYS
ncbi:MAG: hypothetical protein RLZ97_132, partial [Verrucomicrobiota bacterium]